MNSKGAGSEPPRVMEHEVRWADECAPGSPSEPVAYCSLLRRTVPVRRCAGCPVMGRLELRAGNWVLVCSPPASTREGDD